MDRIMKKCEWEFQLKEQLRSESRQQRTAKGPLWSMLLDKNNLDVGNLSMLCPNSLCQLSWTKPSSYVCLALTRILCESLKLTVHKLIRLFQCDLGSGKFIIEQMFTAYQISDKTQYTPTFHRL